jgi:hypothetical protein
VSTTAISKAAVCWVRHVPIWISIDNQKWMPASGACKRFRMRSVC